MDYRVNEKVISRAKHLLVVMSQQLRLPIQRSKSNGQLISLALGNFYVFPFKYILGFLQSSSSLTEP